MCTIYISLDNIVIESRGRVAITTLSTNLIDAAFSLLHRSTIDESLFSHHYESFSCTKY